jgi:sulfur-carrier protein adenylyltransferase/sulfurtransferase
MMRLSPAMTWSRHGDDIFVHGESQVLQLPDCPPEADALLRLLEAGCDAAAIDALDLERTHAAKILDWLRTTNCLVQNVSHAWAGTSLERQADYLCALGADPDEAQASIGSARVAILGVGGIGSVVLAHLVSAGFSQYVLIDGDTVQPHNLNRQFIYGSADVGRRKVDAAVDWIASRNPAAVVRIIPRMLTDLSTLVPVLQEGVSLLVVAADFPVDIGLRAAHACLETQTALIGADCGLHTASWGPLLEPADLPAYTSAMEAVRDRAPVPPASRPMTASFGPTNGIVASYLARDIVNWFAGLPVLSYRKKVAIDLDALTAETIDHQEVLENASADAQRSGFRALTENT